MREVLSSGKEPERRRSSAASSDERRSRAEKDPRDCAAAAAARPPTDRKKQVPLRLSSELYEKLAAWAEDEFRSVNGQIEYLLHECVKKRYGEKAQKGQDE
ncbi:hypothetical protein ACH6CV_07980 [Bacillota bacterium Meth-B3]